jgi:hypothetical protein
LFLFLTERDYYLQINKATEQGQPPRFGGKKDLSTSWRLDVMLSRRLMQDYQSFLQWKIVYIHIYLELAVEDEYLMYQTVPLICISHLLRMEYCIHNHNSLFKI